MASFSDWLGARLRGSNSYFDEEVSDDSRAMLNDPRCSSLSLHEDLLSDEDSRSLGEVLGSSTFITVLSLSSCEGDLSGLFVGLEDNSLIGMLMIIDTPVSKLESLAPFLTLNPSLRSIQLVSCGIGPQSVNALSQALLNRAEQTLEHLDLSGNQLGDLPLDNLVVSLRQSPGLQRLWLNETGVGSQVAGLLEDPQSNLQRLSLTNNSINDESVVDIADSLARNKNSKLESLFLHRNDAITATGWTALLGLVCSTTSIDAVVESNHTLGTLGMFKCGVNGILGHSNASLLRASLDLNINRQKNEALAIQHKIIWGHAREDLNIGVSSIDDAVLNLIIAWFANGATVPTQYQHPPIPQSRIRLGSVYRLLLARPGLCSH